MTTLAGTPYFISPEIIEGRYGCECDMWSLGVLLYLLLSGDYPFDGESRAIVFEKIRSGDFNYDKRTWKVISEEAKDLINKLLEVKPRKRYKASDALNHPWFSESNIKNKAKKLDVSIIN